MKAGKGFGKNIGYVLSPLLGYYINMLVIMVVLQSFLGNDSRHYVLCQLIATLLTLPVMVMFYRQGQIMAGIDRKPFGVDRERLLHAIWAIAIMACLGISLNNIIFMTGLPEQSAGYQQANADFYGSTLVLELLCLAVFTPILEELVFRGIVYGRLKMMMQKEVAVGLSAFLFAGVHTNAVQFLYALFLGIALALIMDRAGNVYAAMIGHMTANFIAVMRTETNVLSFMTKGDAISWGLSFVLLAAGVGLLLRYIMTGKTVNQTGM